MPDRAAVDRGAVGRGRPADDLALDRRRRTRTRWCSGRLLGLEPENVRVIAPDVGGGFGGKGIAVEDVLVGWVARATGKPVRWTETRSENMVAMHHGRGAADRVRARRQPRRQGRGAAAEASLADAGAYPGIGAFLPNLTAMMASGVYEIPQDRDRRQVGRDEHDPDRAGARRRPSRGDADARARDRPVRRRSWARSRRGPAAELHRADDAFPFMTASGANYDIGDYGWRARSRARDRRLRRAARGAGQRRARRRPAPARDRPVRLRRGHQRDHRDASSARSRSPPTARRSSRPARSRRARATRRRSRRSRPSASGSRSSRSP